MHRLLSLSILDMVVPCKGTTKTGRQSSHPINVTSLYMQRTAHCQRHVNALCLINYQTDSIPPLFSFEPVPVKKA